VLAQREGWDADALSFDVVGDVYGGLWALNHGEAQGFLWEKYTTQPFVDQGKCKRIGEVYTPWPCFVIAVRNEVLAQEEALLNAVIGIIQERAAQLKAAPDTPEVLAWRYALKQGEASEWLKQTEWSSAPTIDQSAIQTTVETLLDLDLLSAQEAEDWPSKLFK
jgi:hypothetical protein